jgi:NADH:ubiquinone oxidoreductase subunit F (NADH-binding)
MVMVNRVLDPAPVPTLDEYLGRGGGRGLDTARELEPAEIVALIEASGLRGRGGAGFPTGTKWRTVADNRSPELATTVVVNGAEGEPGTFKDRTLMRRNPYRVLEGALIAARAVGADEVVIAVKEGFDQSAARMRAAIADLHRADRLGGVAVDVVVGPSAYLYGEETALLEVIEGRQPFPRIAPPFRQGIDELGETVSTGDEVYAAPDDATPAAPVLVNNVETMANVPLILADGIDWFRELGTAESPGTVVCTVTGRTAAHGVGEFPLGTPLREVLETLGGGPARGRHWVAAMSGVANPLLPAALFDTAVSYEGMLAVGRGLGAAGFIVFDDATDLAAVASGVSRFLSVESCGQCEPCKKDGLSISELLDRVRTSQATDMDLVAIDERLQTVTDGARCYLAQQHQLVVDSVLKLFPDAIRAHVGGQAPAVEPELVAPIVEMFADEVVLDERQRNKNPDWTYGGEWRGQAPADRIDQHLESPQR